GLEALGPPAQVGIDVARHDVFHDAHDEATDDRARDRVEAAQDHHGEDLEPDEGEVDVDPQQVAPDDTAERRHDARHGPSQPEIALHVDAHGHGHLLVVRHRAHGDALTRPEEEPAEGRNEDNADRGTQQLDRRDEQRADHEGLVADGQGQGLRPRPEESGTHAAQDGGKPDGGHDHGDDGPSDQLAQHHPLQGEPEYAHAAEPEDHRDPQRRPYRADGQGHHQARDHHELALREIHRIGRLVDEHESQRDQGVHQADEHTVREEEEEEAELFRHG